MRHLKYFGGKTLVTHFCQINRLFYLDLNTELNNKREELQANTAVIENLRKETLGQLPRWKCVFYLLPHAFVISQSLCPSQIIYACRITLIKWIAVKYFQKLLLFSLFVAFFVAIAFLGVLLPFSDEKYNLVIGTETSLISSSVAY